MLPRLTRRLIMTTFSWMVLLCQSYPFDGGNFDRLQNSNFAHVFWKVYGWKVLWEH